MKFLDSEETPVKNHLAPISSEQPIFHRSFNDLDVIKPKEASAMHQNKTTPANIDSNIIYTTLPRNYKHTVVTKQNDGKNELYREKDEKFHKKCHQCCQNGVNLMATRFAAKPTKHFKSTPELANLHKISGVKNRVKELEDYKKIKIQRNHYVFLKQTKRPENNEEFDQKQGIS